MCDGLVLVFVTACTVYPERDHIIFCNIFYKNWAILMKFGTEIPKYIGCKNVFHLI